MKRLWQCKTIPEYVALLKAQIVVLEQVQKNYEAEMPYMFATTEEWEEVRDALSDHPNIINTHHDALRRLRAAKFNAAKLESEKNASPEVPNNNPSERNDPSCQ